MRTSCQWLLVLGLLFTTSAPAQESRDEDSTEVEGPICISMGQRWLASGDETRDIETQPVPASYRQRFESTEPCIRYWLIEESLIDWHLGFGSERSATAALDFLERDYLRGIPPPEAYERELRSAWSAAQRDLNRAATLRQPEGLNYSVRHRFLERSRTYRRLEQLILARSNYVFLITQYLRAAEEFASPNLLAKAERVLRAAVDADDFLGPLEEQATARGVHFNLHTFRTDDFRMRAAILRAQITRDPRDIETAETILASVYRPLYVEAAENAYEAGPDFCDFDENDQRRSAVNDACNQEDAFPHRVIDYWINRAILDQAAGVNERRDELALRLLYRADATDTVERYFGSEEKEDIRRILMARVARHRRDFAAKIRLQDPHDAHEPWYHALQDLERLERMISPFEQPRRFREVANLWLELYAHALAFDSPDDPPNPIRGSAARQRYATYLRQVLAGLDAIAIGADGAPR